MNLDKSLEQLELSVYHMGERVLKQHEACLKILNDKDKETALSIVKNDDFINRYEEDINNQAMAQFALLSPVASDLRRVLVAIKVASDLERIGDYAKGLAGFIIKDRDPEEDALMQYALEMEKDFIKMLKDSMEAYKKRNMEMAFDIPKQVEKIDRLMKEFKEKLVKAEKTITVKQAFYLAGLFRNIERSGDHTTNICEHIVYLCKGVQYDFG